MRVIIILSSKDPEYYLTFFFQVLFKWHGLQEMKIKITKVSNQRINVWDRAPKGKKIRRDERIKKLLYQKKKKEITEARSYHE